VPYYPPFTGGGSSNSGGLMGTANFLLTWSSDPLISNEKIFTAGANISITTAATTFTISANTGGASNSAGLMGTANFLVTWSSDPLITNEKIFTAGSSVTVRTDTTAIYVDAITANALAFVLTSRTINTTSPLGGGGTLGADRTFTVGSLSSIGSANQFTRTNTGGTAWDYVNFRSGSSTVVSQGSGFIQIDATTGGGSSNSAGLMGTGGLFVSYAADATMSAEKVLTAGSSITLRTDSTAIYIDAQTAAGIAASLTRPVESYIQLSQINFDDVKSNRFYIANMGWGGSLSATGTQSFNNIRGVPFAVINSFSTSFIAVRLTNTSATADTLLRFGIYTNSGNGVNYPFSAIQTSDIISASNVATHTAPLVQTFSQNTIYWAIVHYGTSTATFRTVNTDDTFKIYGADSSLSNTRGGFSLALQFSNGLPGTIGTGATLQLGGPAIGLNITG